MADVKPHPSPQALAAFGLGKLPEAGAAAVAQHLEVCGACRQVLQNLPPDSFMGKLRRASTASISSLSRAPRATPAGGPANSPHAAPAAVSLPTDLPPALVNHPKYRIVRELGRGGMGIVYEAVQTLMDRPIALKVLNPAVLAHAEALPRFLTEVKAAAKLDHPNIVRAHDADQVGDLYLLVMELVEGMNLAQLVQDQGPLPVATACHYLHQAALG
jgi:eukaryotic-like serine/threonine-protein kinase